MWRELLRSSWWEYQPGVTGGWGLAYRWFNLCEAAVWLVLAALVPLTGAVLQLVLAPAEMSLAFRLLVTALIVAGMTGLGVAVLTADHLRMLVSRWLAPEGGMRDM